MIGADLATAADVERVLTAVAELRAEIAALRESQPITLSTVPDVAKRLGISTRKAWRMVADGSLPVQRIGRSVRVDASSLRPVDRATVAALAAEARR